MKDGRPLLATTADGSSSEFEPIGAECLTANPRWFGYIRALRATAWLYRYCPYRYCLYPDDPEPGRPRGLAAGTGQFAGWYMETTEGSIGRRSCQDARGNTNRSGSMPTR
jgi:hypothetical protein